MDWGSSLGNQADDENVAPTGSSDHAEAPSESETESAVASSVSLSTRASRAWLGLLPALIVLIVILVFVFQNSKDVEVSFFTFSGTFPLSVALLSAVVLGALMALALGSLRIYQLRKRVVRTTKRFERN